MSLVRGGRTPFTHETWLGRPFQSDLTGFPSVDVKSIGAGGGSIAWTDGGGVLHVGPQSAGAAPGPACYGAGGARATVTDAALVVGYIDPDYFLGGQIRLDPGRAEEAIRRDVAEPLGLPVAAAAATVIEVWTENMVQAIADITVNQGIDPAAATVIGGGGAAGLNAVAIAARLNCGTLIIPDVAAALSAAGAVASDIAREFRQVFVARTDRPDTETARKVIAALRDAGLAFVKSAGASRDDARMEFVVEARYPHQVWEIDVAIEPGAILEPDGMRRFEAAFHEAHERIFAFADPGSAVEIIGWRVAVRCPLARRAHDLRLSAAQPSATGRPTSRSIYFRRHGWLEAPVRDFGAMPAGTRFVGPAIVESPYTAIVIDPSAAFSKSARGNLIVAAARAEAGG